MHISDHQPSQLGNRLIRARQRLGLNQKELAARLKTHQSTISRIERGQKPRRDLQDRLLELIQEAEGRSWLDEEQIAKAIANSDELLALIRRIVSETETHI